MSLELSVAGDRWRDHLRATAAASPGLIPVAKGNGYGLGIASLARRAEWLGCDTIAVGTYWEVPEVVNRFGGDVVVLEPWRPFTAAATYGRRIIHTVGRASDLTELGSRDDHPRIALEGLSSMTRHGFPIGELRQAAQAARGVRIEGQALHLPLGHGHLGEIERWLEAAPARRWYLSHVAADELARLRSSHPDIDFRPRIGTALWLGDKQALTAKSTVLDVHEVSRGDRVGYRQRAIPRDGWVLVVSGGTAHGIGLEAPASAASVRNRARSLVKGGLEAAGFALSPFVVGGKQRWFVEPPHMLVSLLFLPGSATAPAIGEQVEVEVRYTTTHFDSVHLS